MTGNLLAFAGTAFLGGLLPLFAPHSGRLLHLFVALSTGVFLGIVFLHLLPEVAALEGGEGGTGASGLYPWGLVLLGFVGLYAIEKLILPGSADPHVALGWGSFLGLSVHAFTAGMSFVAATGHHHGSLSHLEGALFLSIVGHKVAEGFSLATVLLLGGLSRGRIVGAVLLFSLATPAGLLLGSWLLDRANPTSFGALTALATGTFLFVALGDLLPEVFHERRDTLAKLLLVVAGVAVSHVVSIL